MVLDASQLFAPHVTWIGFRRGRLLRGYMYEFLKAFAPHLTRRLVDQAIRAGSGAELARLFEDVALPTLCLLWDWWQRSSLAQASLPHQPNGARS